VLLCFSIHQNYRLVGFLRLNTQFLGITVNYLLLSFLSFFVGIIVGLTGVGGASLITPMLIFFFQVPASIAVSSDVVAATLMKVVGGFKHWQQQTLDLQVVKWLALGSVPGSLGWGVDFTLHQVQRKSELRLHIAAFDRSGDRPSCSVSNDPIIAQNISPEFEITTAARVGLKY
jgi:Predicted permeases